MDLTNIAVIKNILEAQGLWAKKKLGQHFLIDKKVLGKIIESADLKSQDVVLEIGSGLGALTLKLLKKVEKVVALEKDQKMAEIFKTITSGFKNLEILNEDALKFDLRKLPKNYKVVANIPYYITSPLLKVLLEAKNRPKLIVLMVQKEVAERIMAISPNMNILAIAVQFYAKPEIVGFVLKNSFFPKPKVDSAIIKILPRSGTLAEEVDEKNFFRIVKIGFSSPRKQLQNNLRAGLKISKEKVNKVLEKSQINPSQRPQELSINDWIRICNAFLHFIDN